MTSAPSWVAPLREAASGKPHTTGQAIEVARGEPPSWLGSDAVHAITSAFLAALVVAAALLRSDLQSAQFDLIALLLRTASVAFVVRALLALFQWCARLSRDARAAEHVLAWSNDGILWCSGATERWLLRSEIAAWVVPEQRSVRGAVSSLAPLYVVSKPSLTLSYWALPPYFGVSAEVLRARLERWQKPDLATSPAFAAPAVAAEERYLRAARGQLSAGEIPVPEGFGYRLRAPYGVLLSLVFVADALVQAGPLRARVWPAALLAAALAPGALLVWFAWMRSRRAVRLGLALLLTREELLIRGKHGVVSVPWTQLTSAEVHTRLTWSPLVGSYLVRTLWLATQDGAQMPFDGGFLGVPPEVVAALAEAYRLGAASAVPLSASQGSGAGGGISSTAGTTASATTRSSPSRANDNRSADDPLERSSET